MIGDGLHRIFYGITFLHAKATLEILALKLVDVTNTTSIKKNW